MTNEVTTKTTAVLEPSGKVRQAIDLMIWQGHHRDDAAKAAGLTPKSLYNAFRKHHVKRYYGSQLEVLRTSARARNFHRLEAIAQQDSNPMAAVGAIKEMERQVSEAPSGGGAGPTRFAGVTVIVMGAKPDDPILANPSPHVRYVPYAYQAPGEATQRAPLTIEQAPAAVPVEREDDDDGQG